jgi:hypothetical protein
LEKVRKRAIQFLVSKIPTIFETDSSPATPAAPSTTVTTNSTQLVTKDLEDLVVKYVKKV